MNSFSPQLAMLPPAQRDLWPRLGWTRAEGFVLYGGTAIALQLGHRTSVDFDFFSNRPLDQRMVFQRLAQSNVAYTVTQQEPNALTVVTRPEKVLLSFFGTIDFGCVRRPLPTQDELVVVASLLDLMGTKLKVILQRVQAKDYLDVVALLESGIRLEVGLGAATTLYGSAFSPAEALKALTYFVGGDLSTIPVAVRSVLLSAVAKVGVIPVVPKLHADLTGGTG